MKNLSYLLILSFLLIGCTAQSAPNDEDESVLSMKAYVDVVYWHESNRFSFFTTNKTTKKAQLVTIGRTYTAYFKNHEYCIIRNVHLYLDVNKNEKPWYECSCTQGIISDKADCSVHIESYDKLNTADWNHGKHGAGSTSRLN